MTDIVKDQQVEIMPISTDTQKHVVDAGLIEELNINAEEDICADPRTFQHDVSEQEALKVDDSEDDKPDESPIRKVSFVHTDDEDEITVGEDPIDLVKTSKDTNSSNVGDDGAHQYEDLFKYGHFRAVSYASWRFNSPNSEKEDQEEKDNCANERESILDEEISDAVDNESEAESHPEKKEASDIFEEDANASNSEEEEYESEPGIGFECNDNQEYLVISEQESEMKVESEDEGEECVCENPAIQEIDEDGVDSVYFNPRKRVIINLMNDSEDSFFESDRKRQRRTNAHNSSLRQTLITGAIGAFIGSVVTFFGLVFAGSE